MKTLGQVLKESREKSNKTLREVQETTGFSTAYLSQLENGKIKKPSANVLYQLSITYLVELNEFLAAAGIIEKQQITKHAALKKKIAFHSDNLSEDEEEEILKFIEYIKFKKGNA